MKSESQTRLLAVLLGILTLAAVSLSIANFVQENDYILPTDGVRWTEAATGLRAASVPKNTPAERAGIRKGDVAIALDETPIPRVASVQREMTRTGAYSTATYSILRGKSRTPFDVKVILEPADRSDFQVKRLIALVYLALGLYVLFRRWTAPQSTHFFVFCLVSFTLYAFQFTGQLDGLDLTILWGNILALALQPALFLHFALAFADDRKSNVRQLLYPLLYLPGAILVILRVLSLWYWSSTERMQHKLDQVDYSYLAGYYVLAAVIFWVRHRREDQPLERQQLKWLSRGTLLTVIPFTALYVIPFLSDVNVSGNITKVAVLSLILLPLTFSWAIVRYRLMDVDLIVKRGVAYSLATAALVGVYFGVIALTAEVVHSRLPNLRGWGLVIAVIVTGLVFDPLKRAIQGRVDRMFDRKQLDYRETLVQFGRELNAQTNLAALLQSIVERLPETLLLTRVAVFLAEDERGYRKKFKLASAHGLTESAMQSSSTLDLGFLDFDGPEAPNHIFFENPRAVLRLPKAQQESATALDLNYYVPCRAARHEGFGLSTIAVLGLGRTGEGDFLSSEDVELLESLAGYIGIAIQNAQLYKRLEQKIVDFERLHEFNENIVESINIGVFAVDLDDKIESWNAQMEVMYATPRLDALRKPLSSVFSEEFIQEFARVRDESGVTTLYKFRLPTPSGEIRTANITMAPLLNRDFTAVGRIVIVDDITDRINMETQLTQAEKLSSIGLLAAGVAHEVNTPLAVISSYAQMLGKQLRADEASQARLQPVLDKITQQTFRASEIVNGLLNFSRMGSVELGRVDLNAVIKETVLLLEHSTRSGRVTLETHYDSELPAISGNRGKLQQVLVNLIMNAKDALQDESAGHIRVSSSRMLNGGVEVSVTDNGPGMPPEVLRKIYDPFFTTKVNPKEGQRKGTGLGLAVTYGIMQEHGGTIEAVSNVGDGTLFRLLFPPYEAQPLTRDDRAAGSNKEGSMIHV